MEEGWKMMARIVKLSTARLDFDGIDARTELSDEPKDRPANSAAPAPPVQLEDGLEYREWKRLQDPSEDRQEVSRLNRGCPRGWRTGDGQGKGVRESEMVAVKCDV